MQPMVLSPGQAARFLDVPERFIRLLCDHRMFPQPDRAGCYPLAAVQRARTRLPWLRYLNVPLDTEEMARLISPRVAHLPKGLGFEYAGRRYVQPWRLLEYAWRPDASRGHEQGNVRIRRRTAHVDRRRGARLTQGQLF